jgi:hypothetical protein
LCKAAKQSHDGLEVSHAFDAKDALENRVVAGNFAMLKAVGTTPYREHELGDELFGCLAPVRAGLGQTCTRQGCTKPHVIEHALHQAHAAPSGDFFVRKTKLKVHGNSALKSRSATLPKNSYFPQQN